MRAPARGWQRVALDGWPLALALLLCLPLLTRSGYPLARDLVFVPSQPLTDGSIGLGSGAPRAVPLDAVVAVLTRLVDGGVLARVVLPLTLAAAGWGAHRLVAPLGTPARLAAGGFAVWNPYVVERLALGQWALLAAYAAMPWVAVLAGRWRRGEGPALGAALPWLGLASLTPTGGLLGSLVALAAGGHRARRCWWLVGGCALLQLPWLLPALVGSAGRSSDPDGVDAFSADGDGPGGVLVSLLGLGGIWDARSVPATREGWWTPVAAVVVVALLVGAWRGLDRATGGLRSRLTLCAGLGLLLALLPHLPWGEALLRWAMIAVPGAGLLRDGQKLLAPLVVLASVSLGVVVERAARRELAVVAAVLGVLMPVVLLPDGPARPWRTLDPVHYPEGFERVASALGDRPGDLATLPWRGYRLFGWAHADLTTSDPALRWYDRTVLVSDDLQVGTTLVHGESRRGRELGADLARRPVARALRDHGVSWAVVYPDDPEAPGLDLAGLQPVVTGGAVELYRVPGAQSPPGLVGRWRALVASVDLLALLVVALGGAYAALRAGGRRWRRRVAGG